MIWYVSRGSGGQGLVIDEADGRTVAVAYDAKDAELLAASPDLLQALQAVLACPAMNEDEVEPETTDAYARALVAIDRAGGGRT